MLDRIKSNDVRMRARLMPALALAAFVGSAIACSPVDGEVIASGEPFGDIDLDLRYCASGAHDRFPGVILVPEKGASGGIAIVQDRKNGNHVFVEIPGTCTPKGADCKQIKLDKSQCSTFELKFEQAKERKNGLRPISGSLDMVCEPKEGGRAEIHATFEDCG